MAIKCWQMADEAFSPVVVKRMAELIGVDLCPDKLVKGSATVDTLYLKCSHGRDNHSGASLSKHGLSYLDDLKITRQYHFNVISLQSLQLVRTFLFSSAEG